MSDLRDLYQETIIGHAKNPKNFRKIENPTRKVEGYNPLCGDKLTLYVDIHDNTVKDISFEGSGCAISTSSASLMTETIKGKSLEKAEEILEAFQALLKGSPDQIPDTETLGKLAVFSGVCEFPARVKCASLCWHTLKEAMRGEAEVVSTE